MKVLFTIDSLQQGGAEQSIANIIKYFSSETEVGVLYFYPKSDLRPLFESLNCKIFSFELTGKYNWVRGIRNLRRILREENPDIVVTSLYRSNFMSRIACKIEGKRLIGTFVDDPYSNERKDTFKGLGVFKFHFFKLLDRLTAPLCYGWISNSNSIARSNASHLGVDPSRIRVIYRGRDSKSFSKWEQPSSSSFQFIAIGRLYEKKGYPELLTAFKNLIEFHPSVRLVIYGEGAYRSQIEAFISQNGLESHVILAGNVPNAWMKIYESNCFVFPSRFEGFSGALVEAMMTGVPIIASDIPMNTEAITHMRTALVHKLRDDKDLLDKMKFAIEHFTEMKEMGQTARIEALGKYDIRTISSQYENQLQQFIAAKN
jgi:glycosyltransferase involved in cell wall biosynthesis